MAELTPPPPPSTHTPSGLWTSAQTRAQFSAIAWLRWRILVNGSRRKGGTGELIGRILISILFLGLVLSFVLGAGFIAYLLTANHHPGRISWLLWGIFILCQLLNIQLGQPATTFDPTQLIRFPLRVDTYVAIRLFFGLLSPANISGTLMSLAVAIGIIVAAPALWLYALIALGIFAATNVLFSRMIFAWIDRWLSTRRAREVFTAFIFIGSLAIQWANFKFNPAYNNHHAHTYNVSQQRFEGIGHLYQLAQPWLAVTPPNLASTSLIKAAQHSLAAFSGYTLAAALYGALFLLVFALRMRTEFRGENLSDAVRAPSKPAKRTAPEPSAIHAPTATHAPIAFSPALNGAQATPASPRSAGIANLIAAIIGKEILYTRRNTGILYGLIMPIFLVLIFAGKFATHSNALWVFPAAVAYTLLAICPLSYNSFGYETTGAQLYFLAPIRLRDVFLAKNLLNFLMGMFEIALIFAIITYMSGMPSLRIALASVLWAIGVIAINFIFGNQRSLTSPKKIDTQRMARRQASQLSAFISMGILMVLSGLAAGLYVLCFWLHQMWALIPIFAIFAAVCVGLYLRFLNSMDRYALDHREELFTELCKQT